MASNQYVDLREIEDFIKSKYYLNLRYIDK